MLKFATEVAREAGGLIKARRANGFNVAHKGRIDLVTDIDRASQDLIVHRIRERFGDHDILAEEDFRVNSGSDFEWIIDPLDGTTNFVHGLPLYCVSIAVYRKGDPYIGVCYNPAMGDIFYAAEGEGAFWNGQRMQVSRNRSLLEALLVTGFPYESAQLDEIIERFSRVVRCSQGVRRLGSAALDLCYVARGDLDGFWESGLRPWDMAAGVVIVREAGGMVTALDGSVFDLNEGSVLAANERIHAELRKLM